MNPIAILDLYRAKKLANRGLAEPYATIAINQDGRIEVQVVDRYGRRFAHEWNAEELEGLREDRRKWEARMLARAADRAEGVDGR